METFSYLALDRAGAEVRGTVEANDAREAARLVRARAAYIIEVVKGDREAEKDRKPGPSLRQVQVAAYLPVNKTDQVFLFRQLALMLQSGHTVVQALTASRELVSKRGLAHSIGRMATQIEGGASFSKALQQERRLFKPLVAHLVETGESTGQLDHVLRRLAANMEAAIDLRRRLTTSLVYPLVVLFASVGVVYFLMTYVLPKYRTFFEVRRSALPPAMEALMASSDWLLAYGPYLTYGLLGTIFAIAAARTSPRGTAITDRILLSIPIVGRSVVLSAMAQFGSTLSMLLNSGLTVIESMRILEKVMGNARVGMAVRHASERILAGQSLSVGLDRPPFPPLVRHLAAVGEASGDLAGIMEDLGAFFESQLDARARRIAAYAEPVLILGVGGLVAFIYLAVFQTIFQASIGG